MFDVAGNAANGNGSDSGDWIYKSAVTVQPRSLVGVDDGTPSQPEGLLPVSPNPAPGRAQLGFDLARGGPVALELFDLSGRRVREIVRADLGPGRYRYEWNGADDHGSPLPAGMYLVRLSAPGLTNSQRVALVR
jgi:flagellar hook capping protein FlgD